MSSRSSYDPSCAGQQGPPGNAGREQGWGWSWPLGQGRRGSKPARLHCWLCPQSLPIPGTASLLCQDTRQGSRNPSPLASAECGLCCLLGTRNIHPLLASPRLWQIVSPLSVLCPTRDTEPAAEGVSGWLQPHLLWSVQGRRDGSAPCQGSLPPGLPLLRLNSLSSSRLVRLHQDAPRPRHRQPHAAPSLRADPSAPGGRAEPFVSRAGPCPCRRTPPGSPGDAARGLAPTRFRHSPCMFPGGG